MSRILVVSDDGTATVEVMPMADPTAPDDEAEQPWYAAACRTPGCDWNSFTTDNSIIWTEADVINEADSHLDRHTRELAP